MKLLSVTLLSTVLSASLPAFGQQEMQRGRDFAQGRMTGGMHQPGRNQPSRDRSAQQSLGDTSPGQLETEQRAIHEPVQSQGHERMSPEERQQLRRDINAAGRDIYRHPRTE